MFPYPILSDNSEAQHSSISIYIPSAGRSFMLEFRYWFVKDIWSVLSKLLLYFWSSAVRISFPGEIIFFWSWGKINENERSWIMIPICWMLLVSWRIFSNNRRRPFRSRPFYLWTFWVLLISSADSGYFCAFVLFWLEIRLITVGSDCFW